MGQHSPKSPKMGPRWANIAPRWAKIGQHSSSHNPCRPKDPCNRPSYPPIAPSWTYIASRWGNIALSSCPLLDPYHLNMGPWPAVARKRLNSGQGPREGPPPLPPTYPVSSKTPAFYGVFCCSHFSILVVNMGQHRLQDGPT